ncbi:hypothetical protein [Nocardia bovistercoris]|uniref:DUF8020 domain-containing protein n=1 Tax=Nocardia bovistercoris TaxID=2785916 RepID=A0A931N1E5_9NOCA|nr:hypothetical protein [Nocardia bovistercoris]MBH0775627.1 hypothetical protein [Nocardia bovistercoris]
MKFRSLALAVASTSLALAATAGVGSAASEQSIGFSAHATDTASIISINAGSLVVADNVLRIETADGAVVAGAPLTFRVEEFEFPIDAAVSGREAVLTPRFDMDRAIYKPVALPHEDKAPWKNEYDREQAAWSRMTSTIGMGASLGTLIGGIAGGGIGCVLGGIAGATVASATIVGLFGPFVPAAVVGCVGGIAAVGAIGTLIGQIAITAPVAIGAAIQYAVTTNQPFVAPAK